ncbi:TRAP transporter permease [Chloroflexota bacterium]
MSLDRKQLVDRFILFASAAVAILYLYTAYAGQLPLFQQRGIILGFCFILTFIQFPMLKVKGKRPPWTIAIDVVLSIVTILALYQFIKVEVESDVFAFYIPDNYAIALGAGLVLATLEATRRTLGAILPLLAIVCILYAAFGHVLPGMFGHLPVDFYMIVYYLSITTEGIFGLPVYVASTIVVIFLIFASLLRQFGLMEFFTDIASGLMGRYRGGPAKIAVLASAFMATMSGSAVANVAATGSITIPLMKRTGYTPDFAGAVEACASTGGVVTPPVMGAAAFIIAEYLGVTYWTVCIAAFLPAALYFFGVYLGVDLEAIKSSLKGLPIDAIPSLRRTLLNRGYMLIPIFVLIFFLGEVRSSAMLAAFWGVVSILAVSLIRRETRREMAGFGLIEGLAGAVQGCIVVLTTCACAGIVVGVLSVTGLGMKLSTILVNLTGGNVILLLFFCAVVCIILGMGITTTAVYLLMAMIVAPSIIRLGISPLAAHLFVFFFGNLANITPPVCVAAYVAAGISGGKPFRTGWQAVKLGAVLFLVPFFFCLNPSLILQGSLSIIVVSATTAVIGVIALAFAMSNYWWWGKLGMLPRLLFGLGGLGMVYPAITTSVAGGAIILIASLYQHALKKGRSTVATQ